MSLRAQRSNLCLYCRLVRDCFVALLLAMTPQNQRGKLYCPRARTALFYSRKTGDVILNGAKRSEESLCLGSGEERFFATLRMTGKAQFLTAQSINQATRGIVRAAHATLKEA